MHLLGATTSGGWVTQVARNLAADLDNAGRRLRFLIRDRDTKFTASFDQVFATIGVETIRTPVRSPRANAFAERWVRTVRDKCLDDILMATPAPRTQVISAIGPTPQEFFASAAKLAAWAGRRPGNHESAGTRRSGRRRHGNQHLQPLLVEAAWLAV